MHLLEELNEIEHFIEISDKQNINISIKAVDWHLDHSLKVVIGVCGLLKKSDPSDYSWKFNGTRFIVFLLNFFPRGKAKSPRGVLPRENISKEDLKNQLNIAQKELNSIVNLPAKSNFKHPYFGYLNLKKSVKFLQLHTTHHLKICRDIEKKR